MSTEVMLLVLLGALFHASWNALVHGSTEKLLDTVLILCGSAALSLLASPWLRLPALASLPWLLASAVIHMAYFALVIKSYRSGELSIVYPVMRGAAPALSALGVLVFMHESPGLQGWLGVALISAGIVLIAAGSWADGRSHRHSLGLALFNAAVIALYTLVDARGARLSGDALAYTGCLFVLNALAMVLAAAWLRGMPALLQHGRKHWLRGLGGGACTLASYALALWAMTRAPVALVAALRETSVVFAVLLAAVFAREKIGPWKILSIAMVAGGAVVMKLG
ncbi:MAG: Integral rane protein [Paucimonas sp.]|nr:Integral rane protein [Paucimonas sp.]